MASVRSHLVALVLGLALPLAAPAAVPEIPEERQIQLRHVLIQECGSCHGMSMRGGLGSSLRPEDLDKPDSALKGIILYGVTGTAMPGWHSMLSEAEAAWLVQALREGVGE